MNFLELKLTKRLKVFESALYCNLGYLLLVLIMKGIQGLVVKGGVYNTVFGLIEFVVAALYWLLFNWVLFRHVSMGDYKRKIGYIVVSLIPIILLTTATIVIMYFFPSYDFSVAWNQFTFVIAPTLFWYLPYGYLFVAFGGGIPLALLMVFAVVLSAIMQFIGILIGTSRYAHEQEKIRQAKLEQQRKARERKRRRAQQYVTAQKPRMSPIKRREAVLESSAQRKHPKPEREGNPFRNEDTTPIIYTEAISVITDDMLDDAPGADNEQDVQVQNIKSVLNQDMEDAKKNEEQEREKNLLKEDGTPNWAIPKKTRRRNK